MQPIHIYFIIYIVPIFLLITLSTYVVVHNSKAVENRLIALILLLFSFTLLGEFARHTLPFEWNPFITMYIVGFSTMTSMATILYLVSVIVQKQGAFKKSFLTPLIIYSIVPIHFLIISLWARVTIEDFQKDGIWIYRTDSFIIFGFTVLLALLLH